LKSETGFRELERNMLHEVAEFENVVISTGVERLVFMIIWIL